MLSILSLLYTLADFQVPHRQLFVDVRWIFGCYLVQVIVASWQWMSWTTREIPPKPSVKEFGKRSYIWDVVLDSNDEDETIAQDGVEE